ncbi:hypothetical protein [Streptomyces sp. NPDC003635]
MSQNDTLSPDLTWWRTPLVVTLIGLTLLAWQCAVFGVGAFGVYGGVGYWGFGLFVVAWALPRRRSARMLRNAAAAAGLLCLMLPLVFVALLATTMA